MNLYTRLRYKRTDVLMDVASRVLDWCIDKWGHTCKVDAIHIVLNRRGIGSYGYYDFDSGTITINVKENGTLRDFIDTIIHEFIHSTQKSGKYYKLDGKYGYDNNPYEIEAVKKAKKWRKICWYGIK